MIIYMDGDILASRAQIVACPVNTSAVMGAGLALKFRNLFPDIVPLYEQLCRDKKLEIGRPAAITLPGVEQHIMLFPTKQHWTGGSRIEWIERGLRYTVDMIEAKKWNYSHYAFPALGCGLGGLDWNDVRMVFDTYFAPIDDIKFDVYKPGR